MSIHHRKILVAFIAALQPYAGAARAEDKDPFAVVEIGGTGQWSLNDGGSSFGPAAAVEFSPVKNWLVVEAGAAVLLSRGQTEWDADAVFQKAFRSLAWGRVRAGHRPGLDPHGWRRQNNRFHRSGGRVRLHVLADAGSQIRLVFRAKLHLLIR